MHDISTLWPPQNNDDNDDDGGGGGTYPCASRCLLLFFLSSPTALVARFAFAVRPIVTTVIVSRDAAAVSSGGGRWDGGAKCRTGLLGRSWRPIDPAHTANGKRSAAETSQASRFSSVRKAAGSLSSLPFLLLFFEHLLSTVRKVDEIVT